MLNGKLLKIKMAKEIKYKKVVESDGGLFWVGFVFSLSGIGGVIKQILMGGVIDLSFLNSTFITCIGLGLLINYFYDKKVYWKKIDEN